MQQSTQGCWEVPAILHWHHTFPLQKQLQEDQVMTC